MRRNRSAHHLINRVFCVCVFKCCVNKNVSKFIKFTNKCNFFTISYPVLSLQLIIYNVYTYTRIRMLLLLLFILFRLFRLFLHICKRRHFLWYLLNVIYLIWIGLVLDQQIWYFFTALCLILRVHSQDCILKRWIVFDKLTLFGRMK